MGPDTYSCLFFSHVAQYLSMYMCLLPLWLTLYFTDLCICMYIYTTVRGVAPAHTPENKQYCRISSQNKQLMRQYTL